MANINSDDIVSYIATAGKDWKTLAIGILGIILFFMYKCSWRNDNTQRPYFNVEKNTISIGGSITNNITLCLTKDGVKSLQPLFHMISENQGALKPDADVKAKSKRGNQGGNTKEEIEETVVAPVPNNEGNIKEARLAAPIPNNEGVFPVPNNEGANNDGAVPKNEGAVPGDVPIPNNEGAVLGPNNEGDTKVAGLVPVPNNEAGVSVPNNEGNTKVAGLVPVPNNEGSVPVPEGHTKVVGLAVPVPNNEGNTTVATNKNGHEGLAVPVPNDSVEDPRYDLNARKTSSEVFLPIGKDLEKGL